MTIVEKTKVLAAYNRAAELGADHDHACATVAQALSLPVEAVHSVVDQQEVEVQS